MRSVALIAALVAALQPAAPPLQVDTDARAVQPGEVVVLTARAAMPLESLRVTAFGRSATGFQVDSNTWRALVGIDLEVPAGPHKVAVSGTSGGKPVTTTTALTVQTKAFPTRRLNVDNAFVNPPASVQARIAKEAALLRALWMQSATTRLWSEPFLRPVKDAANSAFGSRSIFNGQARQPHTGADFLSPTGTPILSPNAGRVVLARDLYYSGNSVVVDHGLGLFSFFAHLSAIDAKEGSTTARGDLLGKVGATGRVTGPHLHWTVRLNDARVDPLSLLAVLGTP